MGLTQIKERKDLLVLDEIKFLRNGDPPVVMNMDIQNLLL